MRRDGGEVAVLVSIAGAAATAGGSILAVTARQAGENLGFWAGVVIAVVAAGSALGLVWRKIGAPLAEVLGGRPPSGVEGEPGFDPGQPPLSTFIRDQLKHRDLDERWKLSTQEQIRDLSARLDAREGQ